MIPVKQTLFGKGKGNCYAACLASLLDLSIEEVPNFCCDHGATTWFEKMRKWVEAHSEYTVISFRFRRNTDFSLFGSAYWIASGKSPRGDFEHAVIYCGAEMVHDPHPDETGIDGRIREGDFLVMRKKA